MENENDLNIGPNEKVGDYLRRIREARGIELEQLAKSIRLGKDKIQLIEENKWSSFPTEAYLRSYISSISEKLSIDKNLMIKRFASEVNSHFAVAQMNIVGEEQNKELSSGNIAKIAVIVIAVILVILFLSSKTSDSDSEEKLAPEAPPATELEAQAEDIEAEVADSLATDSAVAATQPEPPAAAGKPGKGAADALDTLRFECTPSATDNMCGISVKNLDTKMNYFTRALTRNINHHDTVMVTVTVPLRTRVIMNNSRLDYGSFNTLYFYRGELINKINRDLR